MAVMNDLSPTKMSESDIRKRSRMNRPLCRKTFPCPICGCSFLSISNREIHMKVHVGDKGHTCSVCDRVFVDQCSLKDHMAEDHVKAGQHQKKIVRQRKEQHMYGKEVITGNKPGKKFVKNGKKISVNALSVKDTVMLSVSGEKTPGNAMSVKDSLTNSISGKKGLGNGLSEKKTMTCCLSGKKTPDNAVSVRQIMAVGNRMVHVVPAKDFMAYSHSRKEIVSCSALLLSKKANAVQEIDLLAQGVLESAPHVVGRMETGMRDKPNNKTEGQGLSGNKIIQCRFPEKEIVTDKIHEQDAETGGLNKDVVKTVASGKTAVLRHTPETSREGMAVEMHDKPEKETLTHEDIMGKEGLYEKEVVTDLHEKEIVTQGLHEKQIVTQGLLEKEDGTSQHMFHEDVTHVDDDEDDDDDDDESVTTRAAENIFRRAIVESEINERKWTYVFTENDTEAKCSYDDDIVTLGTSKQEALPSIREETDKDAGMDTQNAYENLEMTQAIPWKKLVTHGLHEDGEVEKETMASDMAKEQRGARGVAGKESTAATSIRDVANTTERLMARGLQPKQMTAKQDFHDDETSTHSTSISEKRCSNGMTGTSQVTEAEKTANVVNGRVIKMQDVPLKKQDVAKQRNELRKPELHETETVSVLPFQLHPVALPQEAMRQNVTGKEAGTQDKPGIGAVTHIPRMLAVAQGRAVAVHAVPGRDVAKHHIHAHHGIPGKVVGLHDSSRINVATHGIPARDNATQIEPRKEVQTHCVSKSEDEHCYLRRRVEKQGVPGREVTTSTVPRKKAKTLQNPERKVATHLLPLVTVTTHEFPQIRVATQDNLERQFAAQVMCQSRVATSSLPGRKVAAPIIPLKKVSARCIPGKCDVPGREIFGKGIAGREIATQVIPLDRVARYGTFGNREAMQVLPESRGITHNIPSKEVAAQVVTAGEILTQSIPGRAHVTHRLPGRDIVTHDLPVTGLVTQNMLRSEVMMHSIAQETVMGHGTFGTEVMTQSNVGEENYTQVFPGSAFRKENISRAVRRGISRKETVKRGTCKSGTVRRGSSREETVKRGISKRGTVRRGSSREETVKRGTSKRGTVRRGISRHVTATKTQMGHKEQLGSVSTPPIYDTSLRSESNSYTRCCLCGKVCSLKDLKIHVKLHTGEMVQCERCGQVFSDNGIFNGHLSFCEGKTSEILQCEKCGQVFSDRQTFSRHICSVGVQTREPVQCDKCRRVFSDGEIYDSHLTICELQTVYQLNVRIICALCGDWLNISTIRTHLKLHTGELMQCSECGRLFSDCDVFSSHLISAGSVLICPAANEKGIVSCHLCGIFVHRPQTCDHLQRHSWEHIQYNERKVPRVTRKRKTSQGINEPQ